MTRATRESPTLAAVIRRAMDRARAQIRVSIPAKVISFDSSAVTCDVQPLIRQPEQNGDYTVDPPLKGVPVVYSGSRQHRVRFPLSAGDQVLLLFSDRAIDEWALALQLPEVSNPSEKYPAEYRSHSITDAVAIPLATFAAAVRTVPTDRLELQNGDVTIALTDAGEVLVHDGTDADAVSLAKKSELSAVVSALDMATAGGDALVWSAPTVNGTSVLKGK